MTALRFWLSLTSGLLLTAVAVADEARGRILKIDPDKKELRLETRGPGRGGVMDLKLDAKTEIFVAGQPAKLNDLIPGRRIRVVFEMQDGMPTAQVIRSLALIPVQPAPVVTSSAPAKEGDGVVGTLQRIGSTDREIVVIGSGSNGKETETTIAVPEETAITRDGKKITLDELKEGEKVLVKTESSKDKLAAVSIQIGQAAPERSAAPPRRNVIPRLRQALKNADQLLREMEQQQKPTREGP